MEIIKQVEQLARELQEDFDTIAQSRSAYTLEHLVVGAQEHVSRQWHQCVLEMERKYYAIKRANIRRQITLCEIEELEGQDDRKSLLGAELKRVDLEETERAISGAFREFQVLYSIYRQLPRFTAEQYEAEEAEYWFRRLTKQATQDLKATGTVSVGNQEALRQIKVTLRQDETGQFVFTRAKRLSDDGES